MNQISDIRCETGPQLRQREKVDFAFFLCPSTSMLDVTSAIEILSVVNRHMGSQTYSWCVVSLDGEEVTCTNGMAFRSDTAINQSPSCDRIIVCAFDDLSLSRDVRVLGWLRKSARLGVHLGALGTGAALLVEAGLVGNRAFTLHWSVQRSFFETHPDHRPERQIFTTGDNLMTCAGGQSVSDMMLTLVEQDLGTEVATRVADHLVGGKARNADTPQRLSAIFRYKTRNQRFLSIVEDIEADDACELSVEDVVDRHQISRRQLERLFNRFCDTTPSRFIKLTRLERAKEFLEKTEMSVLQISVACGFGSAANFSRSFSERYNCKPCDYRT